ncbi:MAG: enoyl-CoA hydratase/isomerase family protein [Dehalococcoidia bacterium]|nr:enoyl-CoA hydratase [Chloroflexi bacterium CFX7]NUQ55120.1 enoyl-CoA hydratase/isomerase family protein [Dehalococcoidia bacterium]RIL03216.1 MAG: enoyl-CoA hydratase [bacterium]
MELHDVLYEADGGVARITLNRPQYRNAQSYRLLDELDVALDRAMDDRAVKVVIVTGAGDHFSSGHDLGTPESLEDRQARGIPESGIEYYDAFRKYNYDLTHKWRNLPRPTIAMVRGYCIYGGWMIASAMDLVFASEDALFLAGLFEYFSVPWDLGPRKTKELLFESRFITATEAHDLGFVNRVYSSDDLERETVAYARRVAENGHVPLRMAKLSVNKAMDMQGYSSFVEAAFADYLVQSTQRGVARTEGERRLNGVDLALRHLRGQRAGQPGGGA